MNKIRYMYTIIDSYGTVDYDPINTVGQYIYKSNFIQFPRLGCIAIL